MSLDKYSRFDHGSVAADEIRPRAVSALGLLYPWLFLFLLVASGKGGFEGWAVVSLEGGSARFAVVEVVNLCDLPTSSGMASIDDVSNRIEFLDNFHWDFFGMHPAGDDKVIALGQHQLSPHEKLG